MKKLLLTLLLGFIIEAPATVQAQSSLTPLENPSRGFRYENIVLVQSDGSIVNAWNRNEVIDVQSKIDGLKINYESTDEHVRLSQLYIYLTAFVGGDISPAALTSIQGILNTFKANNLQVLLRWVYDYDGDPNSSNPGVSGVTFVDITNHLNQLTPIVKGIDGVISNMNGGVLGLWGEWHNRSASLLSDQAGLDNMFTEILDGHLPAYMSTQVRMPSYKTSRNIPQELLDRIGFHNDFFTAGEHSRASGNDYVPGSSVYQTVKEQSPYVIVDGEMPYDGTTEWYMTFAVDVYKTLKIFNEHHYNSFSVVHSFGNNISLWKSVILDKAKLESEAGGIRYHADYFTENDLDVDRTMYEFVRDHLGYRLYIDPAASDVQQNGQSISYSIDIENYGFSRPYTNNAIKIVLLDRSNNIVASADNDTDMREWQPVDWQYVTTQGHKIDGRINLDASLATNTYKLGFYMPSKSLGFENNNAYAIKLANRTGVEKVTTQTGKNIYVVKSVSYDSTQTSIDPYCSVGSNGLAQDRVIESITTSGALANINSSTALLPVNAYARYSSDVLRLTPDSTFELKLANSTNTKWSRAFAWLDWNNDGDFTDANEELFALGSVASDNSAKVMNIAETISLPSSAVTGNSRLRIRFHDSWLPNSDACGIANYSTTFDIDVNIQQKALSYCKASNTVFSNETSTRKSYFVESLTTTGGNQNVSYNNGEYPISVADGHGEHLSSFVELSAGSSFNVNITNNIPNSGELHAKMTVWIDYNGDGDFDDANEIVLQLGSPSQNNRTVLENISEVVTVPTGTTAGDKRMRVRMRDSWLDPATSCGDNTVSSTIDFLVKVI